MDGLTNINPLINQQPQRSRAERSEPPLGRENFSQMLQQTIQSRQTVNFSKHANMRLNDRSIQLTGEQLERVNTGLNKAHARGIRDSLVLVDDVALVVNVKSKTVITAIGDDRDNIFSNIDGAVIV
ncbi:MAG: flagellar protein [Turicibacter sp.]|nr:flagellar protein [Turicibacter sp.]